MFYKIKRLYWKLISYNWRPHEIWYRLKCFCWHRYTTTKPRYLSHQWCDRCALLPHTVFEILSRFIEEECSPGHIEWYGNYGHKINGKYVRDEMQELYDWWHKVFNKAYPQVTRILWRYANKYDPIVDWVKLDDEFEEYNPRWNSEESERLYGIYMDAINKLERTMEKELKKRLHRVIEIMPYMWT